MKKFRTLKLALASIIGLAMSANTAVADSATRIDWSFKASGENQRPTVLGGSTLPAEKKALFLGPEGDSTVYLTFDAGYANENVESILDTLKKHDAKGAFFILPGIMKYSPDTVKRMADEGHTVCNHSTTHGDMSKITDIGSFEHELTVVAEQYRELTGRDMAHYFRPPQGAFSQKTLDFCEELGYTAVFWSFAYADWDNRKQPDPEMTKSMILSRAHDGMVMLLHPTSKTNAEILDSLLTELESRGYRFGSLDELYKKCYG